MHALLQFGRKKRSGFAYALSSGILVLGLALAAPAAGMSAGGAGGAGAAGGGGGAGGGAGAGGGSGSAGGGGAAHRPNGQTELAWARSDRIRGCARPAAVGRNAGVAPTVTSGQCATRSDSSKFASGYPRGRLQEAFWRCCAARALWVDPKRLAGSTSGRAPSVRF
jgi:hypothetical protein